MSLPKVNIEFQNARLGRVDDPGAGIPGMIVPMATSPTGHAFGDAKPYSVFDDLPEELQAVEGVKNYFAEAPGYNVYIMPVPITVSVEDILDPNSATPYAVNLINANDDINFIGIVNAVVALASVVSAGNNGKALRLAFEGSYRYIRSFVAIAYGATLPDLGQSDYTATGFVVCPSGHEVGLLLARRAKIRVQRNIGRVKDGPVNVDSVELISGTPLEESMSEVEEINDKRYISLRTYVGKAGYYFTDDPLAVEISNDYAFDTDRAVIDKAAKVAYNTYLNEINDDIEIDDDGTISTTAAKELQGLIENAINATMTAYEEISYVKVFVDETQNIVSTSRVEVALSIGKKGYLKEINVKLGFDAPNS